MDLPKPMTIPVPEKDITAQWMKRVWASFRRAAAGCCGRKAYRPRKIHRSQESGALADVWLRGAGVPMPPRAGDSALSPRSVPPDRGSAGRLLDHTSRLQGEAAVPDADRCFSPGACTACRRVPLGRGTDRVLYPWCPGKSGTASAGGGESVKDNMKYPPLKNRSVRCTLYENQPVPVGHRS